MQITLKFKILQPLQMPIVISDPLVQKVKMKKFERERTKKRNAKNALA